VGNEPLLQQWGGGGRCAGGIVSLGGSSKACSGNDSVVGQEPQRVGVLPGALVLHVGGLQSAAERNWFETDYLGIEYLPFLHIRASVRGSCPIRAPEGFTVTIHPPFLPILSEAGPKGWGRCARGEGVASG
jgi:hypothetical protein